MRLSRIFATALALATAASVVGLSATAAQAASGITIVSAGNPAGQPSVLNVTATDTLSTGITGVTAQLTPIGGGTTYSAPALALASGTATNGTWSVTIPPNAITAGNYTISVTATDASGPDTDSAAGTLAYLYQPALTAMTNVSSVSYGSETVIFSGQLTALPPGGGTAVPEAGVDVYYAPPFGTPVKLATTQSDGTYSATLNNVTGGSWYVTTNASGTVAAAQSNEVTVTGVQADVELASLHVSSAKYGQNATFTGQVTAPGASSVAGIPVQVIAGSATLPAVTTDSSGNFSVPVPTADGENLQVTVGADVPLLTAASAGVSYTVAAPIHARLFTAKILGSGYVLGGICILTDPTNFSPFNAQSVQLQYAPRKGGPWRNLGKLPAVYFAYAPKSCQGGGWGYYSDSRALVASRLLNAYYRVTIPGSATNEAFTSPVVHSTIGRSRIVSFSANRTSVSSRQRLKFTGTLQRLSRGRWRAYSRQWVYLEVKTRGQRSWLGWVVRARSNSRGHFTLSFIAGTPRQHFVFAALFFGSTQYLWSISRQLGVTFNGGATPTGERLGLLIPSAQPRLHRQPGLLMQVQQ